MVANQIKTVLLLVALSALFLLIGYGIGGHSGMIVALLFSVGMNFMAYWFSDRMVLAMHRAQPIGPGHSSGVYEMVSELVAEAGLPMPKTYLVPEALPNAFATGRDPRHAAVAVTDGILRILDSRELRGVLAHEVAHIRNHDILISTLVASLASAIMYLTHMIQWMGFGGAHRDEEGRGEGLNPFVLILMVVLAPMAAILIQAALSRSREFRADETGAHCSRDPEALASALEKISDPNGLRRPGARVVDAAVRPAFAHLYIVNHFSADSILSWFSTHPPVRERIRRLRVMIRG